MKVLMETERLCSCCMEKHTVQVISVSEHNVFKNVPVVYRAEYFYCDRANETYADEQQISSNDISMKNAYREKMGVKEWSWEPVVFKKKKKEGEKEVCENKPRIHQKEI